jgi:hypothetical protein
MFIVVLYPNGIPKFQLRMRQIPEVFAPDFDDTFIAAG